MKEESETVVALGVVIVILLAIPIILFFILR